MVDGSLLAPVGGPGLGAGTGLSVHGSHGAAEGHAGAGQVKSTTADAKGKWVVKLDALSASSEPKTMTVRSKADGSSVKLSDAVVGEVWICSGQSNMQFGIGGAPEVKALLPKAKSIRTFDVKRTVAY